MIFILDGTRHKRNTTESKLLQLQSNGNAMTEVYIGVQ